MVTDKGFDLEWSHLPQSIGSGDRDCGLEVERPALPWSSVVNRCAIYTRKSSDEGLEQGFNKCCQTNSHKSPIGGTVSLRGALS